MSENRDALSLFEVVLRKTREGRIRWRLDYVGGLRPGLLQGAIRQYSAKVELPTLGDTVLTFTEEATTSSGLLGVQRTRKYYLRLRASSGADVRVRLDPQEAKELREAIDGQLQAEIAKELEAL